MPITGDDQFEWRSFKVGDGTSYNLVSATGLGGGARVRRNPQDRVGAHGVVLPRTDLLTHRTVLLRLEVEGTSRADLQDKLDALDAATLPSTSGDDTLVYRILGDERRVYARPSPAEWMWERGGDIGLLVAGVEVEFFAQDPRIYANTLALTVLV